MRRALHVLISLCINGVFSTALRSKGFIHPAKSNSSLAIICLRTSLVQTSSKPCSTPN